MCGKFIFILALALFWLSPLSAESGEIVPVMFEDYPPYEYVADSEVKGVNVELIREAFRRMGMSATFEPRPWRRSLEDLKSGHILALSSGFRTAEREEYAYFPSESLAMETNVIAALVDSTVEIKSLANLHGLKVGVVDTYTYGKNFDSIEGLDKVATSTSHQLLRMLLGDRLDVAVGNKAVFTYLAKQAGQLDRIKYIYTVGSAPLNIMFSKARGRKAEELCRGIGDALRAMREDGTYAAIEAKY